MSQLLMKLCLHCACLLSLSQQAAAEAIPFEDFIFLQAGMSQAEVYYRVGPPDLEDVVHTDYLYKKIWYYIPDGNYSGDRISTLVFDFNGKLISLERTKPLQRRGF